MIKVAICGALGKMGKNVAELLQGDGTATAFCGIDPMVKTLGNGSAAFKIYPAFKDLREKPDVIIDFSSPAVLTEELDYAVTNSVPVVIGSTGFTEAHLKEIDLAAKKVAVFKTANFSLGVNLLCELVKRAAEALGEKFDVEIIEKHHNQKVDAPSGTALMLADSASSAFESGKEYLYGREGACGKRGGEIGLHAVRGGTIVGEHDVMFCGEDEIITLSHSARSKKVFAAGAVKAAKWIYKKPAGKYDMKDVLENL